MHYPMYDDDGVCRCPHHEHIDNLHIVQAIRKDVADIVEMPASTLRALAQLEARLRISIERTNVYHQ